MSVERSMKRARKRLRDIEAEYKGKPLGRPPRWRLWASRLGWKRPLLLWASRQDVLRAIALKHAMKKTAHAMAKAGA